jgi:hypothetical protein
LDALGFRWPHREQRTIRSIRAAPSHFSPPPPALQVQQQFFCSGTATATNRDCAQGWTLAAALSELAEVGAYAASCKDYSPSADQARCYQLDGCTKPSLAPNTTERFKIFDTLEAQRQIMLRGGVLSGMYINQVTT